MEWWPISASPQARMRYAQKPIVRKSAMDT
jgi:hypothetical protein